MEPINQPNIEDVSDTALWVANFRAIEGRRPDAVFRDPLADVLLGERGRKLAESMPDSRLMEWFMVIRTSAIDRLIATAIEQGADTVINLGAGLDTRPYRMRLPQSLRWIEVDFPHMVRLKDGKLAKEKTECLLERVALDLSKRDARREFLASATRESKRALVITEGVIPYLTPQEASELAEDLAATPAVERWIIDYYLNILSYWQPRSWKKKLESAPFRFKVADWFAFLEERGWRSREKIVAWDEAERLKRPFPFMLPWSPLLWVAPGRLSRKYIEWFGFASLERARPS
jgi:methyltransferase (TIGR00027 family)